MQNTVGFMLSTATMCPARQTLFSYVGKHYKAAEQFNNVEISNYTVQCTLPSVVVLITG